MYNILTTFVYYYKGLALVAVLFCFTVAKFCIYVLLLVLALLMKLCRRLKDVLLEFGGRRWLCGFWTCESGRLVL